jgi:hypothetical protein
MTIALPLGVSIQGGMSIRPVEFVGPVTLDEHARDEPEPEEELGEGDEDEESGEPEDES